MLGRDDTQRWYDLVPAALNGHRPNWANLLRSNFGSEPKRNLAKTAKVRVDSFYGTINNGSIDEFYQTLNQVAIDWKSREIDNILDLKVSTVTPNFDHFVWRFDNGQWNKGLNHVFTWQLHPGENRFEIAAVNAAGRTGRSSILAFEVELQNKPQLILFKNGISKEIINKFQWESFTHPGLKTLRNKYNLDAVIAAGKTDLERVCLLRDWVKSRWDHDQPIISPPWDANYILDHTDKGIESYYCVHYSVVFMQCCLSLGIPARLINLHRGICGVPFEDRGYGKELNLNGDEACDEHVINEVWVDDLGKWVMMDVDFNIHFEQFGKPLNVLDIHNIVISNQLATLEVQEGPLAWKMRFSENLYQNEYPPLYRHFCVFWRNNHLSDPEGPTQVLHWIDDQTTPLLLWQGEDLRHRPNIIGPVGISWPYSNHTPVLNDQNLVSAWASSDEPTPHWVELQWEEPVTFTEIEIVWANYWGKHFSSRHQIIYSKNENELVPVFEISNDKERWNDRITVNPVTTKCLLFFQPVNGGSLAFPNRFWVSEIAVF
ncbi:MAG: transglutaminase domain-containing protein [Anaerolineaceae bacterium]|jgi:hypothetical protein